MHYGNYGYEYCECPSKIINDHRCFGGVVYESDFYEMMKTRGNRSSPIAERIMSDWRFDEKCKRKAKMRDLFKGEDISCSER